MAFAETGTRGPTTDKGYSRVEQTITGVNVHQLPQRSVNMEIHPMEIHPLPQCCQESCPVARLHARVDSSRHIQLYGLSLTRPPKPFGFTEPQLTTPPTPAACCVRSSLLAFPLHVLGRTPPPRCSPILRCRSVFVTKLRIPRRRPL